MIRPHAHASDVRRVVSVRSGSWASGNLRVGLDQMEPREPVRLGLAVHDGQESAALDVRVVLAIGERRPGVELTALGPLGVGNVGRKPRLQILDGSHGQAAIRLLRWHAARSTTQPSASAPSSVQMRPSMVTRTRVSHACSAILALAIRAGRTVASSAP